MNTMEAKENKHGDGSPRIWSYRNPREFLKDVCDYRRKEDTTFSYRQLGRWAELKSPNYIPTYLQGKRNLRPETALRVAEALALPKLEQDYFVLLTQFEQAESESDAARWYRELLKLAVRHGETGRIDVARLDYFTCWYIPVIHAMASLKGFQGNPHWIAARIVPKIRSYDAQKALNTLVDLGIFSQNQEGVLVVNERRLETAPELQSLMVREYHRAMIRLSETSLDAWDPQRRTTSAVTITVADDLVAKVLDRIEGYREDMFSWLVNEQSDMDGIAGNVMQINFQAFPVTDVDEI